MSGEEIDGEYGTDFSVIGHSSISREIPKRQDLVPQAVLYAVVFCLWTALVMTCV